MVYKNKQCRECINQKGHTTDGCYCGCHFQFEVEKENRESTEVWFYALVWNDQEDVPIIQSSLKRGEFKKAVEQYKEENIAFNPPNEEDYNVDELIEWLNRGGDPTAIRLSPIEVYF